VAARGGLIVRSYALVPPMNIMSSKPIIASVKEDCPKHLIAISYRSPSALPVEMGLLSVIFIFN
jgi:hypothetical protein